MSYLTKDEILFERDEKGELLPVEATVDRLPSKPNILMTPITRGEFKRIRLGLDTKGNTTEDQDLEIIETHLINPKLTREEIVKAKSAYIDALVLTILENSGLVIEKNVISAIEGMEDSVKKK